MYSTRQEQIQLQNWFLPPDQNESRHWKRQTEFIPRKHAIFKKQVDKLSGIYICEVCTINLSFWKLLIVLFGKCDKNGILKVSLYTDT